MPALFFIKKIGGHVSISEIDVERAALLHDIGKLYRRAGGYGREAHSIIGERVLHPFFAGKSEAILRAIAYHHQGPLKNAALPSDDISYIIYEADNLSAGVDRREIEDGERNFSERLPLANTFNVFRDSKKKTDYPLHAFHEKIAYPQPASSLQATQAQYKKLAAQLNDAFAAHSPADMTINELLQLLEDTMSFVPSSTNGNESADISLYDHQKLTAAFAACLWHYFKECRITDYKSYCYGSGKKVQQMHQSRAYLLVSGNIFGIQNFVYNIPSKGALKSLRGRSLYIDLLLQNSIDELLAACEVSRSCLLYAGGGHFYLLLPNTVKVKETLAQFQGKWDDWFLTHYGSRLYFALAYTPCSSDEFKKTGQGTYRVFYRADQKLFQENQRRYTQKQLQRLFDPDSIYNRLADNSRECGICHTSAEKLYPYVENEEEKVCNSCNNLYRLGQSALSKNLFYISHEYAHYSLPLPGYDQEVYVQAVIPEELAASTEPRRLYVKNALSLGNKVTTPLWLGEGGNYDEAGKVLEFADLAAAADGIPRLGFLRVDVDNLQAGFQAGFSQHFDTLSRQTMLSKEVALFFTRVVNTLCQKEEKGKKRRLQVIYAGGDDLCMVGAWDDLLAFSLELRHAFSIFTNDKLTFSAGLGFFKPSFPVSQMMQRTTSLLRYAKENPQKNSLALFGEVVEYGSYSENMMTARYTWEELEDQVIGEKIHFLESHFSLSGTNDQHKLKAGKGLLYRLLDLMRHSEQEAGNMNLARFAYVLARMEPKAIEKEKQNCYQEVRKQLYNWYQDERDRQELITAIELIVYRMRQ